MCAEPIYRFNVCADICHSGAIEVRDELEFYNAYIDENKCVDCGVPQSLSFQ